MKTHHIPGLALAITHSNQVLHVQGYGTANNNQPVTPQMQFLIASVSKLFTAIAVMQLVEAGQINLDSTVQTYLPEFTLVDLAIAAKISIGKSSVNTVKISHWVQVAHVFLGARRAARCLGWE